MLDVAETPIQEITEHDLQSREAIIEKPVDEKLLVMLKLFAGKKQVSRKRIENERNWIVKSTVIFEALPPPPPPPPPPK